MKTYRVQVTWLILFAAIVFCACSKEEPSNNLPVITPTTSPSTQIPPTTPPGLVLCADRPVIHARLVPIGFLSEPRIAMATAAAGNKILFAGGMKLGAYSSRVDIYDITGNTWSTAELSVPERQGMAVATVGNKILFAGGGDNDMGATTSRVDIYDASANSWSVAALSEGREYLASATLGNKVFFAGGRTWDAVPGDYSTWGNSNRVDIYDNNTGAWTTATLTEKRSALTATTVGSKIFFSGGFLHKYQHTPTRTIDVFDAATNSWSVSQMLEPKGGHAGIAVNNKIFWAGGVNAYPFDLSNQVEIRDLATGSSSVACMLPKHMFDAVVSNDNIVFFTGNYGTPGTHFDIYNSTTNQWSTGVLDKAINDASIVSVNNTIYVAGGRVDAWGPYSREVWKLEF
jgi:hypothetical protein